MSSPKPVSGTTNAEYHQSVVNELCKRGCEEDRAAWDGGDYGDYLRDGLTPEEAADAEIDAAADFQGDDCES